MNKIIYTPLLFFSICLLLSSCTEDVILDLKSTEPKLIIDASFLENDVCTVLLTTTKDYYDNSSSQPIVTGATITLSDDLGNIEILDEVQAGTYVSSSLVGTSGITYTLSVESKGKSYNSTAYFPYTVPIDSIYFLDMKIGTKDYYSPVIVYQDPPNVANYYYSSISVNGRWLKTVYVNDDKYKDGKRVDNILGFNPSDNHDNKLIKGDLVGVEMRTINQSAYEFYSSLFSTVTANPASSFSGGAIGCFMTYGSSSIQATISDSNTLVKQ